MMLSQQRPQPKSQELCSLDGPSQLFSLRWGVRQGARSFCLLVHQSLDVSYPRSGALFGWRHFPDGASAGSCQPQTHTAAGGWVRGCWEGRCLGGSPQHPLHSFSLWHVNLFTGVTFLQCVIILEGYSFVVFLFCLVFFVPPFLFLVIQAYGLVHK